MGSYPYVPARAALLDGVVDLVLDEVGPPDPNGGWQAQLSSESRLPVGLPIGTVVQALPTQLLLGRHCPRVTCVMPLPQARESLVNLASKRWCGL